MALILKGNAMHLLASKFIVGNPISPKQVYNVFMGGGGGGYQGWIQDFFHWGWIQNFFIGEWLPGMDTGFFHWGEGGLPGVDTGFFHWGVGGDETIRFKERL